MLTDLNRPSVEVKEHYLLWTKNLHRTHETQVFFDVEGNVNFSKTHLDNFFINSSRQRTKTVTHLFYEQ